MKARILFVNWSGGIGGAEIALLRLMRGLNRDRYAFFVWAFQEGPFAEELKKLGMNYQVYPVKRFRHAIFNWHLWAKMRELIQTEQIDLIHANGTLAFLAAVPAAKLCKKKVIWHLVDRPEGKSLIERAAVFCRADQIICNSQFTRESLMNLYPRTEASSTVIYPPIEKKIEAGHLTKSIREEFGISKKDFLVVCVGRLQKWKGQDVLLKAAPSILAKYPNTHFVFVGGVLPGMNDGFEQELNNLAWSLGISSKCRFAGFRSDVSLFLNDADLVVHTSVKPEPFGLVVVEAMAMGKPVLATRAGGPCEIIEDGKNGWLIEPGNDQAFSSAIVTLLEDPAKRLSCGDEAKRHVSRFEAKQIVMQTQELYDAMMDKQK